MARRWYDYFATASGERGGNLLTTAGAFTILVSLALPWFYVDYRLTHSGIPGIRLLLDYIAGDAVASLLPALAAGSAALTALYVLISKKAARSTVFAILTAALTVGAVFSLSVSPEHFGPGLCCVFIGLGAAAIGPFAKI